VAVFSLSFSSTITIGMSSIFDLHVSLITRNRDSQGNYPKAKHCTPVVFTANSTCQPFRKRSDCRRSSSVIVGLNTPESMSGRRSNAAASGSRSNARPATTSRPVSNAKDHVEEVAEDEQGLYKLTPPANSSLWPSPDELIGKKRPDLSKALSLTSLRSLLTTWQRNTIRSTAETESLL
jgi:hypothetical protein